MHEFRWEVELQQRSNRLTLALPYVSTRCLRPTHSPCCRSRGGKRSGPSFGIVAGGGALRLRSEFFFFHSHRNRCPSTEIVRWSTARENGLQRHGASQSRFYPYILLLRLPKEKVLASCDCCYSITSGKKNTANLWRRTIFPFARVFKSSR